MIMVINSLEAMESIVENNTSLSWDGWTVIEFKKSPSAWMSPEGAYQNGEWIIRKRYEWNNGWNIPKKFVSENEQQG
jgi:hypothetical protein